MTAGRIALLWIVLAAAWPVLNLNDPLQQVSHYVSDPGAWRRSWRRSVQTRRLFPAREFAWFGFAFFTIGMTWRHYRPDKKEE